MSTKEYLKKAFMLNTTIDSKIERVTKLKKMADAIGYEKPELKAKILHMERELDLDIDCLITRQTIIARVFREIPDERSRTLLELRYLNHLSWEEIGVRMYLDVRWAQRLHNRAIAFLRIPEAEWEEPIIAENRGQGL